MILKLTLAERDLVALIGCGEDILFMPRVGFVEVSSFKDRTAFICVKETIEEIEQQIMNGGLCGQQY